MKIGWRSNFSASHLIPLFSTMLFSSVSCYAPCLLVWSLLIQCFSENESLICLRSGRWCVGGIYIYLYLLGKRLCLKRTVPRFFCCCCLFVCLFFTLNLTSFYSRKNFQILSLLGTLWGKLASSLQVRPLQYWIISFDSLLSFLPLHLLSIFQKCIEIYGLFFSVLVC